MLTVFSLSELTFLTYNIYKSWENFICLKTKFVNGPLKRQSNMWRKLNQEEKNVRLIDEIINIKL